ncbi:hypothetical protein PQX77_002686, partial [Marasmius sp. AFHP31]
SSQEANPTVLATHPLLASTLSAACLTLSNLRRRPEHGTKLTSRCCCRTPSHRS